MNLMNKYYFITYITRRLGRQFLDSNVIDEHPFNWLKKAQSGSNNTKVLLGWQEISEEEYNMFDRDCVSVQTGRTKANQNIPIDSDPSDLGGLPG
jgi:hypothetical protein